MKTNEFLEIANFITESQEEIKPMIAQVVEAVNGILPEIKPQIERLQDYAVDIHLRAIKRIEDAGFSRSDAIQIAGNMNARLKRLGGKS